MNASSSHLQLHEYDACRGEVESGAVCLIDVRSPREFAEGAIPGALNLPLFSDAERHEIGRTYKTSGSNEALQLGLTIFAGNCQEFLDELLECSQGRSFIVHCSRGGMRSRSVGELLRAMGRDAGVLRGGYKQYRRFVEQTLRQFSQHELIVLNGRTGSGKTEFLRTVADRVPVVDFEGIAQHRGSVFGDLAQDRPSPSQQNFENQLAAAYLKVRHHPRILVEMENVIGRCCLPHYLSKAVFAAAMVLLERDFEDRVAHILSEYTRGWEPAVRRQCVDKLVMLEKCMNRADLDDIATAISQDRLADAIRSLLIRRYDKTYDKTIQRCEPQFIARWNLTKAFPESLASAERAVGSRSLHN